MFEQAFKNIDDVLWKEAGCTTELRLHRADVVAPLPEIPRRSRAGPRRPGRARGPHLRPHPRRALPLGPLGGPQGCCRPARLQPGDDRRRPARLRERAVVPVPARLQGPGHRAEHDRVQDRRDLRRDQEQDPERLQHARDHRPDRCLALPLPKPRSTSSPTSTRPRSATWATRGATAASTTRRARFIRAMVRVTDPKLGETIYDGAVGSAGFLCEAYDYLRSQNPNLTTEQDPHPPGAHSLRQGEEVARLHDRDHEHDPPRRRGPQHSPRQHALRKHSRH